MIFPTVKANDTLCVRCKYSKDRTKNRYAEACYCTMYGYIVSRRKERCKGFEWRKVQEQED